MRAVVTSVVTGVLCLGLAVSSAAVSSAQAQASEPDTAPIVLSVDGAAARLSVTRLRRALSAVLGRPVLRITEEGAGDATGALSMAFVAPRSWIVRLDAGTTHVSRTIEVRGPALETLVGVAVDLIRSSAHDGHAPSTAVPATGEGATARDEPRDAGRGHRSVVAEPWGADAPIVIATEILDPFAGMPITRIAIAAVGELLDPFAAVGSAVRVASSPEVLDPWR
jgi:hypothetical protein